MAEIPLVSVHINAGVLRPAWCGCAHIRVSCGPKAELSLGAWASRSPPQQGAGAAEESPALSRQMGGMLQRGEGYSRDKHAKPDTCAGAHQLGRSCWVAVWQCVGWGSRCSQAEHKSMMSVWHKKGAHYTKVHKHSDIIFFFFSLRQTPVCIAVNCWTAGKYRPTGHNIGEHHELPREHILRYGRLQAK